MGGHTLYVLRKEASQMYRCKNERHTGHSPRRGQRKGGANMFSDNGGERAVI